MATVNIGDWDEKNTASIGNLSDSSSFTTLQKVQPVKITEGTGSGTGDAQFSSSTWSNISSKDDIVVTESDESTTRPYEVENIDTTNNVAWVWVYGSWNSDNSDQIVIGAGTGDGTDYSSGGSGGNPWSQTGVNALMVQHLNDLDGDVGTDDTVFDSTSNNNDGTVNEALGIDGGQFDGAAEFDGTDDYITFDAIQSLSAYTIIQWTKHDSIGDGDTDRTLNIGTNNALQSYDYGSSTFRLVHNDGSNFNAINVSLNNDEWYDFVMGWDGSTFYGFKDGSQVNSLSVSSLASSGLGSDVFGRKAGGGENFDGTADEIRIYSEYKGSTWIQADFDSSPKGGQVFFSWSGPTTTSLEISAQTSTAQSSNPEPTVQATGAATVTAQESTASTSNPEPAVNATGTTIIAAQESTASTSNPEPTLTGTGTASLNATTSTVQATNPEPNLLKIEEINAPVSTATTSNPEPSISGTGNTTLEAKTSTAQATIQQPTISGSGEATIQAKESTASTSNPEPSISGSGNVDIEAEPSTVSAFNPEPSILIKLQPRDASFTTSIKTDQDETVSGDIDK